MPEPPKKKKTIKRVAKLRMAKATPRTRLNPMPVRSRKITPPKKDDKKTVNKKVRAAKKVIRKGKNLPGRATVRAKVEDEVGRQHKYDRNNPVVKKLNSSRLVQRKYKQERKAQTQSQNPKGAYKSYVGKPKYNKPSETYTKKTAKSAVKKSRKSSQAANKIRTKANKASAKVTRKSMR